MATSPATDAADSIHRPTAPICSAPLRRPSRCLGGVDPVGGLHRDAPSSIRLDSRQACQEAGWPSGCTSVPCVWTATAASFAVNANCARTPPRLPSRPFPFRQQGSSCQPCQQIFSSFPCERPRPRRASYLKLSRASPSSPSPFFFSFIDFLIYSSTCFIKLSLPSGHKLSRACCCGINLNPIPCRHHSSLLLPSCVESAHLESCFLFPQAST